MVTAVKLSPRKGYVEKVDSAGNHYYSKIQQSTVQDEDEINLRNVIGTAISEV